MVEKTKSRNSLRHKFGEKGHFLLYLTLEKMIDNTSTEKLAVYTRFFFFLGGGGEEGASRCHSDVRWSER